ncbi:Hsp20 family protein [Halovenus rubra]|uniref:Hsp20 family protein n=2 Tax=Halovenus rubra TaxID=869890 RepID=A0ABD5X5Q8_9EURY|nr:Hsp20 family protein [Halovenus rubra]
MIQDIGSSVGSTVFETVGRVFGRAQEQRPLPADLYESDNAFLAVFDAPGAHPADVQVKYEDGAVVVRVDRFRDFYDGFEMQFPGRGLTLDGHVNVPSDASVEAVAASATLKDNGTLHVHVPKATDESDDALSHDKTGNNETGHNEADNHEDDKAEPEDIEGDEHTGDDA